MENNEKFAVLDALNLSAQEILTYLQNRVSKKCPLELWYLESDGQTYRSFEYIPQKELLGIIINEVAWALEVVPNPDKLSWNARMKWLEDKEFGDKKARIASIPQIHALAKNLTKVRQTVALLRAFGVKVDDFMSGKYLTSSNGSNECVYPGCMIKEDGNFEPTHLRSKVSPSGDIVRIVCNLS